MGGGWSFRVFTECIQAGGGGVDPWSTQVWGNTNSKSVNRDFRCAMTIGILGTLYTRRSLRQCTLPLRGIACKFAERVASQLLYKMLQGLALS